MLTRKRRDKIMAKHAPTLRAAMREDERQALRHTVAGCLARYYADSGVTLDRDLCERYVEELLNAGVKASKLPAAMTYHRNTSLTFPEPGDIIAAARKVR